MSIFDILFGKKPSPYADQDTDYDYYAGLRDESKSKKVIPNTTSKAVDMPPLIVQDVKDVKPVSPVKDGVQKTLSELPIDAEETAYASWAQANNKEVPKADVPLVGKPTIPAQPNIPTKPTIAPITPAKGVPPKTGYYDSEFGAKGKTYGSEFGPKPYVWKSAPPKTPERDVLAFVVENSNDTLEQKESIINIITQTLEKKQDAIFLFIKVGNGQTPFTPMDYKSVKEKNIISSLIEQSSKSELPNLASALFYLTNNLNVFLADNFSFEKKKYKLGSCSIVCIGTGSCVQSEESLHIVSSCIYKLQEISKLKAFKYFCIKDSDAIRAAALGFPVIGHIISDFYEQGD